MLLQYINEPLTADVATYITISCCFFFSNMCMRYIQHSQDYNNKIEVNYTRVLNVNLPWQLSVLIGNWALDI